MSTWVMPRDGHITLSCNSGILRVVHCTCLFSDLAPYCYQDSVLQNQLLDHNMSGSEKDSK